MAIEFHKVVEEAKLLDLEDKICLRDLLDSILREEKRRLIKKSVAESLNEYEEGRIKFGSVEDLRRESYQCTKGRYTDDHRVGEEGIWP
ncbi:hypothetical protein M1O17_01680 [Dehalococcoidia bacterium]|nr:hypothetical protein [Dehalococcoidia bacterium]